MVKSIALSLLFVSSCALYGMEPEQKTVNLSDILSATFSEIKTLTAGQKINVTEEDNKTLLKWIIMDSWYAPKDGHTYFAPNKSKKASIKPGIYILKNNSKLNKNYLSQNFLIDNATSEVAAAHLELYQLEAIPNLSIFKPIYCSAEATYYGLNIIYQHPDKPTETTDHFALNDNTHTIIIPSKGFGTHAKRIEDYTINNPKSASLKNLLLLNRY